MERHREEAHVDLSLLPASDAFDRSAHVIVDPAHRDAATDTDSVSVGIEQHPLTGSAFAKEMSREEHAFAADRPEPEKLGCATA
jgi:hypothetical protein